MNRKEINAVKRYIKKRYNAEHRFLLLDGLHTREELRGIRIDFNDTTFCREFFEVVQSCFSPKTIDLADNDISSLRALSVMKLYLPDIDGISFEDNNIISAEEMRHFKGYRLRELSLKGNPCSSKTYLDGVSYMRYIADLLPSLEYIDHKEAAPYRELPSAD